jgi:hypothetical protein
MKHQLTATEQLLITSNKRLTEFCELLLLRSEELVSTGEALKRLLIRHRCFLADEFADEVKHVQQARNYRLGEIARQHRSKVLDSLLRQRLLTAQTTKKVH